MNSLLTNIGIIFGIVVLVAIFGYVALISLFYRKVLQGKALVRTGFGTTKVAFEGMWVIPLLHNAETMEISLKQVMINREGREGLICKDNLRADIKVVFFVRVNPTVDDVKKVAQTIGCERASDHEMLNNLFEAKFSEALKTVGKQFDFVELYNAREKFREEIMNLIGRDLNGYVLDDAAIDFLEQTPIDFLNENNILDAEGIKKIRELTSHQITLANNIQRNKEKEIKRQDVEAQEAILELNRQLTEKEEIQKREIASIRAREEAEIKRIQQEELTKSERARIAREREVDIEEQNKVRDVIVAQKSKERTLAVENEKVERDRQLESTERERIVAIAQIAKEKAVEEEKKNIQDVIRDRVAVERAVVEEQEKIKDTSAFAEAERVKKVAILTAEKKAQEQLVEKIKGAEADKEAAQLEAQKRLIVANAEREAVDKDAESKKIMADATAEEHSSIGLAEARVMEAKAQAREKEGQSEANVLRMKAEAEAQGIQLKGEAQADANRKLGQTDNSLRVEQGMADATVMEAKAQAVEKMGRSEASVIEMKAVADAKGVQAKAEAMKQLDGVGKDHEEFKLRLDVQKALELARINVQKEVAAAQAMVIAEALKSANIDIIGGEQEFFDRITRSVVHGKYVDNLFQHSSTLTGLRDHLLGDGPEGAFAGRLRDFVTQFRVTSEDLKNLSMTALIAKMMSQADKDQKGVLQQLLGVVESLGIGDKTASQAGIS
jgi:uncharacterized membrane protein YqiK